MSKMTAQEMIDKYFNTRWEVEDFVCGYCNANGIDYYELPPTEQVEITAKVEDMITSGEIGLKGLRDCVTEDVNERLTYIWPLE